MRALRTMKFWSYLLLLMFVAGCPQPVLRIRWPDVPDASELGDGSDESRTDAALDAMDLSADASETSDSASDADAATQEDARLDASGDAGAADASDASEVVDVPGVIDTPSVMDRAVTPDVAMCPMGEVMCGDRCAAVDTDPRNCGVCARDCTGLPHVLGTRVSCVAGVCVVPENACEVGFLHCTSSVLDGCETSGTTTMNCGRCGGRCGPGAPMCELLGGMFSCYSGCPSERPLLCLTGCFDPITSLGNCGACGAVCPGVTNGRPVCRAASCGFACLPGFHACGERCNDDTSPTSCGASCTPCVAPTNATAVCSSAGACAFRCNPGFILCGGACVSDTSVSHCGGCGIRCPASAPLCDRVGGLSVCVSGCSASAPTLCSGSCVDALSNVSHCGACGVGCASVTNGRPVCRAGSCGFECTAGFHRCSAVCSDDTATTTCGASCSPCASPANATATCSAGSCGFRCNTGFHLCAGQCQSDTSTSNCGASCTACAAPTNGTATCDGVRCGFTCNATFRAEGTGCVPVVAPRLVAPLSTARVTSQSPTLRWALATGTDGARVEVCRDRGCMVVEQSLAATGASARVPTALTPGVHFWRARGRAGLSEGSAVSATWEFFVGYRSAPNDTSWGSVPDVNGDGLADVLVVSPGNRALFVYPGRRGGIVESDRVTIPVPGASLNLTVTVCDTNGDGYADAIVGAPGEDSAYVYLGSTSGLASSGSQAISGTIRSGFGRTRASGDVNGDGYADVMIGGGDLGRVSLYYGGIGGLPSSASFIGPVGSGDVVNPLGDVNGDGLADVAFYDGSSLAFYHGRIGGLGVADRRWVFEPGRDEYVSVEFGGDINGDGLCDLFVRIYTEFSSDLCLALGSSGGVASAPPRMVFASSSGAILAGDGNMDGLMDAIVPVYGSSEVLMNIITGTMTGLTTTGRSITVPSDFGAATISLALGDLNGDAVDDLVLIGQRVAGVSPTLQVHHGSTAGWSMLPSTRMSLPAGSRTGYFGMNW